MNRRGFLAATTALLITPTLENLIHVNGGSPVRLEQVGSVGHQATAGNIISASVYRRQSISYRQVRDLFLVGICQSKLRPGDSSATGLSCLLEGDLELVGTAYLHGI